MEKITLTQLRQNLFQVVDQLLAKGETLAIERNGQTLLMVPQTSGSRLGKLKSRPLMQKGNAEDLLDLEVGAWQEEKNL